MIGQLLKLYPSRPNSEWNWNLLSHNLSLTIDDIKEHRNQPFSWNYVSEFLVTMEDVVMNPDLPWHGRGLSNHMDAEFMLNNLHRFDFDEIKYYVSRHTSAATISRWPDFQWDWHYISMLSSMEELVANEQRVWESINYNENINLNFAIANIDNLDLNELSHNNQKARFAHNWVKKIIYFLTHQLRFRSNIDAFHVR